MPMRKYNVMLQLPETDRECYLCEDATFVQDGYELVCPNCYYAPEFTSQPRTHTPWDAHRQHVREQQARNRRPPLPGGYRNAYWGSGSYEFTPERGFTA